MYRLSYVFAAIALLASSPLCAQVDPHLLELHPPPKAAFERPPGCVVHDRALIVVPDNADSMTMRAARYLKRLVEPHITEGYEGGALRVVTVSEYDRAKSTAILIGVRDSYPELMERMAAQMPAGETYPGSGGYVLDVARDEVLLVGSDAEGLFNGIATLGQLTYAGNVAAYITGAHIWDYPDYPLRWVFSQHNLRGAGAMANLKRILDTMAFYKMNGLQQNDFKYNILQEQPAHYFDSVRALKDLSGERNVSIIPGVANIGWSAGILWHDPNLAEGCPAQGVYVMEADTGRLVPDPRVTIPNGSFENVGGDGKFTGWSFYDDGSATPDRSLAHSGTTSARCENFTSGNPAGNSRFNRRVDCRPHAAYVMTAWVRTENLNVDDVRLLALGLAPDNSTKSLTYTAFAVPSTTNGWMKVEASFNTLEYSTVLLYCGVWGGRGGKIWWDDFEIRETGPTNILRREGAPLHVRNRTSGVEYREGVDFAPIVDSIMLGSNGNFGPYHTPPTLRRRAGGALNNGDTLTVSWFHPMTTVSDVQGNGSVMVCVSEPKLYTVLADQISRVDSLYAPGQFFLGHDEIRSMNRDSSCLRRGITPAGLLADNLEKCIDIVRQTRSEAETFVWSDMFDSLHNAHDDYYLVNGDLTGVWDSIPKTPTIVNWNYGERAASLDMFSRLGFTQIASPYYDEGGTTNMRGWRLAMEGVAGMRGMMYTTWGNDYSHLRPFAYYAWGAGPYIIFQPFDSTALGLDSLCFRATVLPDPYDPADSIASAYVICTFDDLSDPTDDLIPFRLELGRDTGNVFVGCMPLSLPPNVEVRYAVEAENTQGLRRTTPEYILRRQVAGVHADGSARTSSSIALRAVPAATTGHTVVWFTLPERGEWTLQVADLLGRIVYTMEGTGEPGQGRAVLNLADLPSSLYHCVLRCGTASGSTIVHVVR